MFLIIVAIVLGFYLISQSRPAATDEEQSELQTSWGTG